MLHFSWIKHHHCITHIWINTYTYTNTIDFLIAQHICNFQDLEANIIVVLWYICMWRQSVWMPSKRWGKNSSNQKGQVFCSRLWTASLLCKAAWISCTAISRPMEKPLWGWLVCRDGINGYEYTCNMNILEYTWMYNGWRIFKESLLGGQVSMSEAIQNGQPGCRKRPVLHTLSNCMA